MGGRGFRLGVRGSLVSAHTVSLTLCSLLLTTSSAGAGEGGRGLGAWRASEVRRDAAASEAVSSMEEEREGASSYASETESPSAPASLAKGRTCGEERRMAVGASSRASKGGDAVGDARMGRGVGGLRLGLEAAAGRGAPWGAARSPRRSRTHRR